MNELTIGAAFDARLAAALNDVENYENLLSMPVAWENTPNKTDDKWLRTQLLIFTSNNGTIGAMVEPSPYIQITGQYIISIFTKKNIGTGQSGLIANDLIKLFENEVFEGVWVQNPEPRKRGNDDFGFYHVDMLLPFTTVS
jgi:hypothetical protein